MARNISAYPAGANFARATASSRLSNLGHPSNLNARDFFMWSPTASNVNVNEDVALNYSAVWAATSLLCSLAGILPLTVWARQKKTGQLKPSQEHELNFLLTSEPNAYMTPYDVKSLMTRGQVNAGNGYAEIVRDGVGRPVSILPVRPHRVECKILRADNELEGFTKGDLVYEVTFEDGDKTIHRQTTDNTAKANLHSQDMLDFRSKLTTEGLSGMGVISHARESIGLGIQAEQFGAEWYGSKGMPRIIVNVMSKMTPDQQKEFRRQWREIYGQGNNPEEIAILPDGEAKIHVLDLNPNDADLLNTRKFTVEEVARWYGLPPHLLQLIMNGGGQNLEQLGVEFVNYSLMPWLHRQQEELEKKLLTRQERMDGFKIRYDVDNLQKGDLSSRVSAYAKMMQFGFTLNEVLEKEGLPPIAADGDIRFFPANMTTIGNVISGANLKNLQAQGTNTNGQNAEQTSPEEPAQENVAQSAEQLQTAWLAQLQSRFDYKASQAVEKLRNRSEPFEKVIEFYDKHTAQHQEAVQAIPGCDLIVDYADTVAQLKKEWN